ncbi:nicotinamide-nucleotide amidase [Orenia metallireducens]|jgi:nicotinamide-nucleotide amidase|uniref:Putative competence-damage inducible protein n=1 Tax=Orenia metallireducens TaxID=1413210 RepID=A0A285HVC6_9FIRM|nr:competence/damage-inducible protein A [Orenia metallireducens]SNY39617.1 nicotinamide-nucleotide amidase [Orenia metallireducens]
MKAEIITIGTELLLGQIIDTNSQWIGQKLAEIGVDLYYKATVGDNKKRILDTLQSSIERSDIIITTGGLGPTQDDLTRECIAEALGLDLSKNEDLLEEIKGYFNRMGRNMADNNIKQAYLPEGAVAIANSEGTAPGILLDQAGKIIVAMPGVPIEMKAMMVETVLPYLKKKFSKAEVIKSRVIKTCGIGESSLEELISDILIEQTNPTIAPLASQGEVKLRLTAKADSEEEANKLINLKEAKLRERIGEYIYGYDDDNLEGVVAKLLWARKLTIATAESCTGGLIGDRLTSVAGSSAYFERGVISYNNQAKVDLLKVKESTLKKYGAVSSQTAEEMAKGVRDLAKTDIGISTTGIAGPGGGSIEKPVGLVYMAIADKNGVESYKYQFNGSRGKVKYMTSQVILNLLRKKLLATS